jgi:hypothetical protein
MRVPLYNLTDTWNNAGTAFTAILMNVTDSAAAATSKLLDLQVGGNSVFNIGAGVNNSGSGNSWDGDFISWANSTGTMVFKNTSIWNDVVLTLAGGANNTLTVNGLSFFVGTSSTGASFAVTPGSGVRLHYGTPIQMDDPTGGSTQVDLFNDNAHSRHNSSTDCDPQAIHSYTLVKSRPANARIQAISAFFAVNAALVITLK